MKNHPPLCEHVQTHAWPFAVELVIDEQVDFTEALLACRACDAHYLLEMLDWRDRLRLYRVSCVAARDASALLRDLARGSCDSGRAGAELQQLRSTARLSPWLLLVDTRALTITGIAPAPSTPMPTTGWRGLPCDGQWIDYAERARAGD